MTRVYSSDMKLNPDSPTDRDVYYEALRARDARFDGVFFVGVSSTRIYCRPVCTVRIPRPERCSYFSNAAAAEQAGFRPCMKCRPELAPGNGTLDSGRHHARQAADRIRAGALNDGTVGQLAASLGLSDRQLRRVVAREYGVTPVALAQTGRLLLAKHLLTDSALTVAEVAFASGFGSVRRFNTLFRSRYGMSPTALRGRRLTDTTAITLRLGFRPPLAWNALTRFLVDRSTPRVATLAGRRLLHTVRLGESAGWIEVEPRDHDGQLTASIAPSLLPHLASLLPRLRHLLDLDSNPLNIDRHLARDPRLAPCVQACPGLRIPGSLDGFSMALRAVLGQQVSVKAATTLFARFVATFGQAVETPFPGLDRTPPTAAEVADAGIRQLIDQGLTGRRAETVQRLARAIADGVIVLDPAGDRGATVEALQELPGIGPWTAHYIAMRALADPDALPPSDLGLLRAMECRRPAELLEASRAWQPWRSYAAIHLWNSLNAGG